MIGVPVVLCCHVHASIAMIAKLTTITKD